MKFSQALFGILTAVVVSHSAMAQDFATGSSPWSRPPVDRYRAADYGSSTRNASYWVERDARYVPSLPSVARTSYRPAISDGYRGAYQSQYGPGGCATAGHYGGKPVRPLAGNVAGYPGYGAYPSGSANYGPLPSNYYKGDGLFGKDTVFAKDQPVRNFFRYLLP